MLWQHVLREGNTARYIYNRCAEEFGSNPTDLNTRALSDTDDDAIPDGRLGDGSSDAAVHGVAVDDDFSGAGVWAHRSLFDVADVAEMLAFEMGEAEGVMHRRGGDAGASAEDEDLSAGGVQDHFGTQLVLSDA